MSQPVAETTETAHTPPWVIVTKWALIVLSVAGLAWAAQQAIEAGAWLIVIALPDYHKTVADMALGCINQSSLIVMLSLSLLAGATITLSTRMQQGTSNDVVKAIVCMITGLLVIGASMLHGAINAIVIFAAMMAGADISILDFLQWFGIVIPFNMLGGLLIITLPRIVRTRRVLWAVRKGSISLEELEEQTS